jgi:2-methylisocitrate lyase-like PEP mutase family enzyme
MSNSNAAREFHALHQNGLLILPNAWDAGSARIIEHAGAKAIATSSAHARARRRVGDSRTVN